MTQGSQREREREREGDGHRGVRRAIGWGSQTQRSQKGDKHGDSEGGGRGR